MKIYNTLNNKKEDFKEIKEKEIKMYVCGPTVYNFPHIGNYRPTIFFDTVKRYFNFLGYKVIYASNVTDIDDKIIDKAIEQNKTEKEIAEFYKKEYFLGAKKLNCLDLDYIPHATEYINDMIEFIKTLIDLGYAYNVDGDVYFRVGKIKDYGILSNQIIDNLESGARIEVSSKKENPLDFTLWKKTDEGIKWDSPFGLGRPGWHTECVVMNKSVFNGMIDIHGGGSDLRFPHHENEIAQQNAVFHNHLANYWMHVGRIDFGNEKMSKSLGNCVYLSDIEHKYDLNVLRFLIIAHNYRQPIKFSYELLNDYNLEYQKIKKALNQAYVLFSVNDYTIDDENYSMDVINKFKEVMDDDFNTPNALTIIYDLVKKINNFIRQKDFLNLNIYINSLKIILNCLGIIINPKILNEEEILLYKSWEEARKNKDFLTADKLRNKLEEKGII